MFLARTGIIATANANAYWLGYLADTQTASSQQGYGNFGVSDSAGNSYITGYFLNSSGGANGFVAKFDSKGNLLWQRKLVDGNTAGSQETAPYSISLDSSNNVYVIGTFKNTSSVYRGMIVKYDSSGTLQWQQEIVNATSTKNAIINGGAVDSSGNVFTIGAFKNSSNGTNASLVKYNSSGTLQWQRKLSGSPAAASQYDEGSAITADGSGNVYVVGYRRNSSNGLNAFVTQYDSSGALQWQRTLADGNSTATQYSYGYKITVDGSSNVTVVGFFKNTSGGFNAYVAKYDSTGAIQWQRKLVDSQSAANQSDQGWGVYTDSANNIYVSGVAINASNGYNSFLVKYDSSGSVQWQRKLTTNASAVDQNDVIRNVHVDVNGNLLCVGDFLNSSGGRNILIGRFPNDGSLTGTYTVDASHVLVYGTASLTDSASSLTDAAGDLTDAAGDLTDTAGSLTDSAGSLTTASLII